MQEFAGLNADEQLRRMTIGKQVLEEKLGIKINTFIPPWNRYDENTLACLERLDVAILSASCRGKCVLQYQGNYLPITCFFDQIESAILAARMTSDPEPFIIALFHFYDFIEADRRRGIMTFPDFAHRIEMLCSQKDVRILSVKQCAQMFDDFDAHRFLLNKRLRTLLTLIPPRLRPSDRSRYVDIQDRRLLYQAGKSLLTTSIVFFAASFFLFLGTGFWVNISRRRLKQVLLLMVLFFIAGLAWDFLYLKIYWVSALVSALVAGVCVGTMALALLSREVRSIHKKLHGAFETSPLQ